MKNTFNIIKNSNAKDTNKSNNDKKDNKKPLTYLEQFRLKKTKNNKNKKNKKILKILFYGTSPLSTLMEPPQTNLHRILSPTTTDQINAWYLRPDKLFNGHPTQDL